MRRTHLRHQGIGAAIDSLLNGLSLYAVPIIIGIASLYALVVLENQYPFGGQNALPFQVFEQTNGSISPTEALQQLSKKAPVWHHDTKLSESPFWISFSLSQTSSDDASIIEIPSRHAVEIECWKAGGLTQLGKADRSGWEGAIKTEKTGFAIAVGALQAKTEIVCKTEHAGPARITILQWPQPQFDISVQKFHRNAGLLDGGLIVLAMFVLVTAIINKEWTYVLFAAWLVANLRLGALSAGWDTQWLEKNIPPDLIAPMRKLTIAAYYILTYALFRRLFGEDLKRLAHNKLLSVAQWTCLLILGYALILPFKYFLPPMWLTAAIGVLVLMFLMGRILWETRSKVAMWYGASLGIAVFANLYEVISAALGFKGLIGTVNSVTAALSSSLMAAFAIAEQMRLEREARVKAQTELRNAYEAIPIGLFTLTSQGQFSQANPALREMLGAHSVNRDHWSDHFELGAWDKLQKLVLSGAGQEMEIRSLSRRGKDQKWFMVKAAMAKDKIEGSLQDVTDKVKATGRLLFLAEHDPLTGILNRRGIEKEFDEAIGELAEGNSMALAYLDLDRFKLINDLFGHVAGDEVLKQVCDRIRSMLTEGQSIGRVGGDEFVIVLKGTPIQSAAWICRGIVDRIGTQPYQIGDRAFQVKGSIGLVEIIRSMRVKDAISVADRACREAKNGNHGNPVVYDRYSSVFREREEELRLIERFGTNAAPEGLFQLMQPIMSLRAPYDSLNFEVLLRMREADGSITPAGKIISAAESNGRIAVIDKWVLTNTLEWVSIHQEHLKNTQFVCLNLSGGSLNDEKFIKDAFSILAQYGRTVERLCIEITESVALHDLDNTRRFIDGVRGFGAKIALDDFGAGYTSFSYLKELPADALKIDGAFVRGVNAHPANLAIVEAIVELARNLGMKSIAEWAEDRATVESLSQIGVDFVQGFAIARPQEPGKLLLAESSASFIEDDSVAAFVRNSLAKERTMDLLDQLGDPTRINLH
jgi:diguanylate cyclase (GGDEF)-like protein